MNFTTKIPITKSTHPIDYSAQMVSLGSCFADNIGCKFQYFKFQIATNPFGIIFNPIAIENLVNRVVHHRKFTNDDVFFHNDLWHSFEVHSALSHPDKDFFLINLNQILEDLYILLTKSTHILITYGTSWIYRNSETKKAVANCHKVPQNQFEKEILSVEIIEKSIQNTIELVRSINPHCNFIFTVSPVRHIKDGFVENQRSKAHLITAMHNVQHTIQYSNYFPSYEIMMDELRDYRFYAEDMLHPNQTAIDYIWERFVESHINETSYSIMEEVASIQRGLAHRPLNPNTTTHQQFLNKLNEKINKIKAQFPDMEI